MGSGLASAASPGIDPLVQAADNLAEHVRFRPTGKQGVGREDSQGDLGLLQGDFSLLGRPQHFLAVVVFQVIEVLQGETEQVFGPLRRRVGRAVGDLGWRFAGRLAAAFCHEGREHGEQEKGTSAIHEASSMTRRSTSLDQSDPTDQSYLTAKL